MVPPTLARQGSCPALPGFFMRSTYEIRKLKPANGWYGLAQPPKFVS